MRNKYKFTFFLTSNSAIALVMVVVVIVVDRNPVLREGSNAIHNFKFCIIFTVDYFRFGKSTSKRY